MSDMDQKGNKPRTRVGRAVKLNPHYPQIHKIPQSWALAAKLQDLSISRGSAITMKAALTKTGAGSPGSDCAKLAVIECA
jgi:hypothetical protein